MAHQERNPVSCDHCGACCLHMGTPPFHDPEDVARLPEAIRRTLERYLDEALLGQLNTDGAAPCIWLDLDTRRCRHHEHRPPVCREFRVGADACRAARVLYRVDLTISGLATGARPAPNGDVWIGQRDPSNR